MTWPGDWTAAAIAGAVRSRAVDPAAATEEALRRIAAQDGAVGAFVRVRDGAARAEAAALAARPDLSELPLAGVPVAIKDNIAVRGEPMRVGSAATDPAPQRSDHPVTARLRAAGAIVVGITAVPELCIWGSTDTPERITRNPWDPARSAGGSSGGAAAAVGAAMVPIAHGADGMGSIRVPGACCGVVGLKPGRGIVPALLGVDSWGGVAENGVLATTVTDLDLVMAVISGHRPRSGDREPAARLRVAVALHSPVPWLRTDPEWLDAARRAADLLAGLGHESTNVRLPYPVIAPLVRWLSGPADDAGALDPAALQPRTRGHIRAGRMVQRLHLVRDTQKTTTERRVLRAIGSADAVLTPALGHSPPAALARSRSGWIVNLAGDIRFSPYTSIWNVLGWPAMTVPAGVHPRHGTPLAAQLAAPPGGEGMLLDLAEQIERHAPWAVTAPGRGVAP